MADGDLPRDPSESDAQPGPDGAPVFRSFTPLCLSYDHRVVDGALAARFLSTLRGLLEDPTRLLFEV